MMSSIVSLMFTIYLLTFFAIFASLSLVINNTSAQPSVYDNKLKIEHVFSGPFKPSNMAFLGHNDILILDRDEGKVFRVLDGVMIHKPLLDVNVATIGYRGMLGIDVMKTKAKHTNVFLYYTQSVRKDGDDEIDKGDLEPLGNRLYRYEMVNDKLINPKLLLDLPVNPGPRHTGGEVAVGPDSNIYLTVGDFDGTFKKPFETLAQNYQNVSTLDGRSGILRVTPDGKPVTGGTLGSQFPLNMYFAYGIRNSFGLDWDPISGHLWDTENGPHYGDEVNLVEPGFNSGWVQVQGIWKPNYENMGKIIRSPGDLVDLNGKGKYSEPEFTWVLPVAPTGLKFFRSNNYGPEYKNDLFVGDANTGTIYHFKLNEARISLLLTVPLDDKIANNSDELNEIIFANDFGRITDLQVGPDGYLYILSSSDRGATIDRLVPK
jgi:aldose sugar dehydrogenase